MKEYDTSEHTAVTPVTVKCNTGECYCVKHCKRVIDWDSEECKQCYSETIKEISKIKGK